MVFRMVWIRAKIDFLEIVIIFRALEIEFQFARTFAEYQVFNMWYGLWKLEDIFLRTWD